MNKNILYKRITSKFFIAKIFLNEMLNYKTHCDFLKLNDFEKLLDNKNNICVLCSGPSAQKLKPNTDDYYLVTNDSYKLVENFDFSYYVNDSYFFRRFLANSPYCKKHINNIFFYRSKDHLHKNSFEYFRKKSKLLNGDNFLISDFDSEFSHSKSNYSEFINFLNRNQLPVKFQNSGIFLLLFGFYLSVIYNKNLKIYGLDLGLGGHIHFDKSGHVGKSVINDRVKINTKKQLDIIYDILQDRVENHSFFNAKI